MSEPEISEAGPEVRARILVIDDEESILEALSQVLKHGGFEYETTSNGWSALGLVESFKPDLIILDIVMPDIDGFTILEQIKNREESRDIPVILLSALDEDKKIWEGYNLGASYYITKPFTTDELLSGIHLILE
ncbi:PleD family two-component system response regulator [Thermodesulfobacteriota bacterium]